MRTLIHSSVKAELENLILGIQAALDDFRSMYPRDPEPQQNSKMRDSERHPRYATLQSELFIPTIEQGRRYALSFYYGKIIGSIRDALRARDQFHIGPHDAAKISKYIEFLGANHPDVKEFIAYDKNTRHIENGTEVFKEMFHKEYLLADTSPKRSWLYDSLFRKIQNKEHLIDLRGIFCTIRQRWHTLTTIIISIFMVGLIFILMRGRTPPSNDTTANSAEPMVVGHKPGTSLF